MQDTVGAGIYSGKVLRSEHGKIVHGRQYQNHNPNPGPVYSGEGYTDMANAIHKGPDAVLALLSKSPELANEISTGGLHTCGMSRSGQLLLSPLPVMAPSLMNSEYHLAQRSPTWIPILHQHCPQLFLRFLRRMAMLHGKAMIIEIVIFEEMDATNTKYIMYKYLQS